MTIRPLELRLTLGPRAIRCVLACALVIGLTLGLSSEQLTISTTYPSPVGVYARLIATGGTAAAPLDTLLAQQAGRVGIGTGSPTAKLHVVGGMRLEDGTQAAGRFLATDASGNARWAQPPGFDPARLVTRSAFGGRGAATVSCAADERMIWGGCWGVDQCSSNDSSMHGGYPQGEGWACPGWHCTDTTAYVRCYRTTP